MTCGMAGSLAVTKGIATPIKILRRKLFSQPLFSLGRGKEELFSWSWSKFGVGEGLASEQGRKE